MKKDEYLPAIKHLLEIACRLDVKEMPRADVSAINKVRNFVRFKENGGVGSASGWKPYGSVKAQKQELKAG
jgi:hypothetical protein